MPSTSALTGGLKNKVLERLYREAAEQVEAAPRAESHY